MNRVKNELREIVSYLKIKIYKISLKRWACLIFLIVFVLAYHNDSFTTIYKNYSVLDYFLYIVNNQFIICYFFMFALIILLSDIYISSNNNYDVSILLKLKRQRWNTYNIIFIFIICILITVLTIVTSLLICLFNNYSFIGTSSFYDLTVEPVAAASIGFIFITLRMFMLGLLIYTINLLFKFGIGFVCVVIVTFIDRFFYEMFNIMKPVFLLPIEHTRILYTEAVAPADQYAVRVPYAVSFLYWAILILLLLIILDSIIKKKDFLSLINRK